MANFRGSDSGLSPSFQRRPRSPFLVAVVRRGRMASCAQTDPYFHRVVALFEVGWGHRLETGSRLVSRARIFAIWGMGRKRGHIPAGM